uniref:Kinesin motor domain-containing protein n=1 Tax=Pseudo-nitzschia australis TaxID=44445 RepID=A0A7S4AAH0_9STRA
MNYNLVRTRYRKDRSTCTLFHGVPVSRREKAVMVLTHINNGVPPTRESSTQRTGKNWQYPEKALSKRSNKMWEDYSKLHNKDHCIGTKNETRRSLLDTSMLQDTLPPPRRPMVFQDPPALQVGDRIEKYRSDHMDMNVGEDEVLKRRLSAHNRLFITTQTGRGARLDRIECTRKEVKINRLTMARESGISSLTDGSETSSVAANQIGCHRTNSENARFQSYRSGIVFSPQISRLGQNKASFLHRQEFEILRMESSQYVREIVAQLDNAEFPFLDSKNRVIFVVRNRPLLDHEVKRGDVSVIEVPRESSSIAALYETNVLPDRKTLDCKIHLFKFDAVLSEKASPKDFYNRTIRMNVTNAINGGLGTVIIFGPDGYGKSRTISDIEQRAAFDIFTDRVTSTHSISIKYMSVGSSGNQFIDLIGPTHNAVEVVKDDGTYQIEGAVHVDIYSAIEFLDTLCLARQHLLSGGAIRQESEATLYLLCEISIRNRRGKLGRLYLLLCPSGDEVQTMETGTNFIEGNPLANLMEILKNKSSVHNLSRTCALTRLLAPSILATKLSKVCLVAAVSPSSEDTEATLLTMLSSREYMKESKRINVESTNIVELGETDIPEQNVLMLPRQWSKNQLMDWIIRKNLLDSRVEGELSGKVVMKMTINQLNERFFNLTKNGDKKANKLFNALRTENDRVARLRVKRKFALQKANK